MRRSVLLLILTMAAAAAADLKLPLKPKSVKFGVIGDTGTGATPQYEVGEQMANFHDAFPFEFVIMLGDNLYGGESPADFKRKFEDPYKKLLDAGVKFFASLGNHDDPNQRFYKPFNMDGKRYYSFRRGDVQFFALDSTYMDRTQLEWLDKSLSSSDAGWKICFFHHPLYSHGRTHGSDLDLRARLEPVFRKRGVSVVFSGHDHVYERLKPQNGINYFVLGNSGQLRFGNLKASSDTAKGMDTDRTFGLVEVSGDQLFFEVVSRTGEPVDSGILEKHPAAPSAKTERNATSATRLVQTLSSAAGR